jgi:hypothetical protein
MTDRPFLDADGRLQVRHPDATVCPGRGGRCAWCQPPEASNAYQAEIMRVLRQPGWKTTLEAAKRRCLATCDGCGARVSGSPRAWQCTACDNYDLCDTCYVVTRASVHDVAHVFKEY